MIKIKHLMETVEKDDGSRMWVEPIGLTKDLQEWCEIDHILSHLGPPKELWLWFEEHPDAYDYFRGKYHQWLSESRYRPALIELARAGQRNTFTLCHQSEDDEHNSATALYEYLSELATYCPPPEV